MHQGPLSELNLEQPLYLGGLPSEAALSPEAGPREPGLDGALQRLVLNGDAWTDLVGRARASERVSSFAGPPCGPAPGPCLNGGLCLPALARHSCSCPAGFGGALCELAFDEAQPRPVAFAGTSFLHFRHGSRCAYLRGGLLSTAHAEPMNRTSCSVVVCHLE